MLMILARLVRSESFWAVVKVRSPHTGPEPGYPRIVKIGDFEAPVAVREKEGERLRGLTARTPTEGGVGRHTSRRRESDRPDGGSGPPRGQTTDRRGGPHEVGGVVTK